MYLFESKNIFPQMAFGTDKPTHVFFYQLNLGVCPHLSEKNECQIYENRPLICRSYPFDLWNGIDYSVVIECPAISNMRKNRVPLDLAFPAECEELYIYKVMEANKHPTESSNIWSFDLATKTWIKNIIATEPKPLF